MAVQRGWEDRRQGVGYRSEFLLLKMTTKVL